MNKSVLPPAWRGPSHPGAAIDHADTELIGHRGWKGTGFLWGEKAASYEAAFCLYEGYNTTARVELSFRAQRSGVEKSLTAMLPRSIGLTA